MRKLASILIITLMMACAYPYGRENYKKLPIEKIGIGMTKEEVIQALDRKPSSIVGSKRDENGHVVDVWYYLKAYFNWYGGEDSIQNEYYLYFYDGVLEKWSNLGDWEKEADQIFEIRIKDR